MNRKLASICLTMFLMLSIVAVLPVKADGTSVSVINATAGYGVPGYYGTTTANFTNEYPPPTAIDYPLGYVIVNITVTDVTGMAGWQLNLTWDPALLEIVTHPDDTYDIYRPTGSIFGTTAVEGIVYIDAGKVFWVVTRGAGKPLFTGSGLACQIKFNITQVPSSTISCDLTLVQTGLFPTKITDQTGNPITYTPEDGFYEYSKIFFIPKPWLEVYPDLVEQGVPLGPSIIGTPAEDFKIDVIVQNVAADAKLVAYQVQFVYKKDPAYSFISVEEGPFLNNPIWAPDHTFWQVTGEDDNATHAWFVVVGVIWNWTVMTVFPDTSGLTPEECSLFTVHFKSLVQEEYTWELLIEDAFVNTYVLPAHPERVFFNFDLEWIEAKPITDWVQGDYYIQGWYKPAGRNIDVYTQWPAPYGGQGPNMPSDMFWPQKQVELYANVTYSGWPQQNKVVTFEIRNPAGELVTILTAISNETGTAHTSYRIPWPCFNTSDVFGIWNITASVDIACIVVNDTLRFHFDYLVSWFKVTVEPEPPEKVDHCENVTIIVKFQSYAWQEYSVLIYVYIHDELNYPIGGAMFPIMIGGTQGRDWPTDWCTYANYTTGELFIHIPKYAVPGFATIHINALSGLPSLGGSAHCPEVTPAPIIVISDEWA